MSLPCSVRDLIPQKGRMGFDQILIKTEADDGRSTTVIDGRNLFLDDAGRLSNIVLIEYVNQLVAAVQGYKARNELMKSGFFVGLQNAEFWGTVYAGDSLTLQKSLLEEVAQVKFIQGLVWRGPEKIARFITKVYEVPNPAEFNLLTKPEPVSRKGAAFAQVSPPPPTYLTAQLQRTLYHYLREIEIGESCMTFAINCPPDFAAFDGHFPGAPILPGIIWLEIARLALTLLLQQPVQLTKLKKMKIGGIVHPDQVITGVVHIERRQGAELTFTAFFRAGETKEISRFNGSGTVESEP